MRIKGRITIGEWSTYDIYAFKDHEELEFCIDIIKGDLLARALKEMPGLSRFISLRGIDYKIDYSIQVTCWQEEEQEML